MARQFGIISNTDGGVTGCILNTVKRSTSAKMAEARNENGAVTDTWYYSRVEKVALSGVMDSTALSVKAGDSLTYGGITYGVNATSVDEKNTGAATFTIEASAADNAELHTYTAAESAPTAG
ncbi:MAG: hypothetical protein IKB16_08585 [Lentisphaeria bacterium]|nr:hypothetical protein [Lentisphaeria bacterium]